MQLQKQAGLFQLAPLDQSCWSFFLASLKAKQRVFQWKAPTAPGRSTDALFVCVLIAAQTHACDCTRQGSAAVSAWRLMTVRAVWLEAEDILGWYSKLLGFSFWLIKNGLDTYTTPGDPNIRWVRCWKTLGRAQSLWNCPEIVYLSRLHTFCGSQRYQMEGFIHPTGFREVTPFGAPGLWSLCSGEHHVGQTVVLWL